VNALATTLNEFGFYDTPLVRSESCPTHGDFDSKSHRRDIWSKCPACSAERQAAEAAVEAAKAKAAEVERWQRKLGMAGIPDRFMDRSLTSFVAATEAQKKALTFATRYAEDFGHVRVTGRGALFVGKPGTGKTHLAVGIALEVMGQGGTALFTTTMRAIRRVKDTWGRESQETESEAIQALVYPDLLILDEVGVQFGSDTEKLILFDVLNERYEKRKPTLLLSNLAAAEVKDFLGERIFDGMPEDGGPGVVFDWARHRGKGGEA